LDVDVETCEVLAETLQLQFAGGCLCLSEEASKDLDWQDTVLTALLSVWRFRQWAESRFLALGSSSRSLVAAILCGLDDFYEFLTEKNISRFYLNGYRRLQGDRRLYVASACFIARVPDVALAALMSDGRVALQYEALWSACIEELQRLCQLQNSVWDAIAYVMGTQGSILRDHAVAGSHVAWHFLYRRVLQPASSLPWTLARAQEGALRAVQALVEDDEQPQERIAAQLWFLGRNGYPLQQLAGVVELLGQCNWTTRVTEQQHGPLASFHRHHPDYGLQTLCTRATLLQFHRLLQKPSEEEKKLQALTKCIQKCLRAVPGRVSGRHVYLKDLMGHLREHGWQQRGRELPATVQKQVFKHHLKTWATKSLEQQRGYAYRAQLLSEERRLQVETQLESLRGQ
jgi:hypothetical protein